MRTEQEIEKDNKKKVWEKPSFQIIAFKNTKSGDATSIEETLGGTVATIS